MDAFYQRFPVAKGEIRLLTVQRSPRVCSFQIARLGNNVPSYKAISYAWGDVSPARASEIQVCGEGDGEKARLPLSQTLADMLQSLLRDHPTVTVWVDAICINQADDTEKGVQVDQMGDVYSLAEQVVVWLGAATATSTAAFRFMETKRGLPWPDGWDALEKPELEGIDTVFLLLDRPWFRRLWVIQEVALSSNVVVACGTECIDFDDFETCVYAVWTFFEGLVDCYDDDETLLGLWGITRLLLLRSEFHAHGAVAWETLLQAASQRLATDSRDKVFAFRSLAAEGRPMPGTDYSANTQPEKVYTDTAIALLCHGESLDLLALAGKARNADSPLPSWVPDHRQFTWNEPFALADGMGCHAGGPFRASPTLSPCGLDLLIKSVDWVARTSSQFASGDVLHQQMVVREVVSWRPSFRQQLPETDWLSLLATSLIFGLDIDDQPADEEEYKQYFDEWYHWLMSSTSQVDLAMIKHNKFFRAIQPRVDTWRAFLSKQGYLGIGPPDVAVGDMLCVAPGCRLPLILRPTAKGPIQSPAVDMALISWCFLQGMMDGEALAIGGAFSHVCLR